MDINIPPCPPAFSPPFPASPPKSTFAARLQTFLAPYLLPPPTTPPPPPPPVPFFPRCFYLFGLGLWLPLVSPFSCLSCSSLSVYNTSPVCYFLPRLPHPPHPSTSAATTISHPAPYRWRLTWESSAIRPPDCLLLRRWMEAYSARLTQPQLHQPP